MRKRFTDKEWIALRLGFSMGMFTATVILMFFSALKLPGVL